MGDSRRSAPKQMWPRPGEEKGGDIGYKLRYLWGSRRQASNSRVRQEKEETGREREREREDLEDE